MRSKNCGILWFLWRTMGCLLGCIRIRVNKDCRDDDDQPRCGDSDYARLNSEKGVAEQKNHLSSLLLSDEESEPLVVKERENLTRRSGWSGSDISDRELRDEAKFLKACGTIAETPAEIRKLSRKFKDISPHDASAAPSESLSSLPSTAISVLLDDVKELVKSPDLTEDHEENGTGLEQEPSPNSCVINERTPGSDILISISLPKMLDVGCEETVTNLQVDGTPYTAVSVLSSALSVRKSQRQKSVRFESKPAFPESSPSHNVAKFESAGNQSMRKLSPCPTPLKLTDDMQTPGTVFATNAGHSANRNNGRIRSQYVYIVLDPPQSVSHINLLKQDGINLPLASIAEMDIACQKENLTPSSEIDRAEITVNEDLKGDFSLDAWLKAPSSIHGCKDFSGAASLGNDVSGRNHGDRVILEAVDANSKQGEELPDVSLKGDGGNVILDSTTKCRQDPKVNWSAIPFEERLERAIAEETGVICQRPMSGILTDLEMHDNEPCYQSSGFAKPLLSF